MRTELAEAEQRRAREEQGRLGSEAAARALERRLEGDTQWSGADGLRSAAAELEAAATIAELGAAAQQAQRAAAKAATRELELERRLAQSQRDLDDVRELILTAGAHAAVAVDSADAGGDASGGAGKGGGESSAAATTRAAATGARLTALQRALEEGRARCVELGAARDEALLSETQALATAVAAEERGAARATAAHAELVTLRERDAVTAPLLRHLEDELEQRTATVRALELALARAEDDTVVLRARLCASEVSEEEAARAIGTTPTEQVRASFVVCARICEEACFV